MEPFLFNICDLKVRLQPEITLKLLEVDLMLVNSRPRLLLMGSSPPLCHSGPCVTRLTGCLKNQVGMSDMALNWLTSLLAGFSL